MLSTKAYHNFQVSTLNSPLSLEIVRQSNLPCVGASVLLEYFVYCIRESDVASASASDVVVGIEFEVAGNGNAGTYVYAEGRRLKIPCGIVDKLLMLLANIESELRTGKKVEAGNRTQSDAIA